MFDGDFRKLTAEELKHYEEISKYIEIPGWLNEQILQMLREADQQKFLKKKRWQSWLQNKLAKITGTLFAGAVTVSEVATEFF